MAAPVQFAFDAQAHGIGRCRLAVRDEGLARR